MVTAGRGGGGVAQPASAKNTEMKIAVRRKGSALTGVDQKFAVGRNGFPLHVEAPKSFLAQPPRRRNLEVEALYVNDSRVFQNYQGILLSL